MPGKIGTEYRPMHPSTVEQIYKRDLEKYNLLPTRKAIRQAEEALSKNDEILSEFSGVEDK